MSLSTSPAVTNSRYSSPGMTGASSSPSPVTTSGPATPGPNKTTTKKPKPFNVFTNDGSFLERFQQSKKEEEEKRRKEEDIINRKKDFESRFRNRGKRARPEAEDDEDDECTSPTTIAAPVNGGTSPDTLDGAPAKRAKVVGGPAHQATTVNASKHN
ncbi:hypothetical protein JOM56_010871 [Amanita muscaria]